MRVVANWLNDHLDTELTVGQMVEALENAGVEVEEVIEPTAIDDRVIAVAVTTVRPHPGADKLQLVSVDTGDGTVEVVCGAPNVAEGQMAALATSGARLPDGTVVKAATIRGQRSDGMLLSPKELGVGNDRSGILVLSSDIKPGTRLHELYSHQQTVLDIKTAANRPDLQGAVGLARELSVHSDAALTAASKDDFHRIETGTGQRERQLFDNQIHDQVPRYSLAKITLSKAGVPSPDWLKERLMLSGIRPINLVVDLTNYAMLETGQPLHAFDGDKIAGRLEIRLAEKSETLVTLDDTERHLSRQDIVIADENGPIALAGVMGGRASEVTEETATLLVEAATFDGPTVRKMALRHGLRTEASSRFERGLPVQYVPVGLERFLDLLEAETKVEIELIEDELTTEPTIETVTVRPARLSELAGQEITLEQVRDTAAKLGFRLSMNRERQLKTVNLTVPYWRSDVSLEEDVLEEVIKVVGLDTLPVALPSWRPPADFTADERMAGRWQLRNLLFGLGIFEVTTYPFVSQQQLDNLGFDPAKHLKLQNPRSVEQTYLRRSLLPSLLAALQNNSRQQAEFGLFEIARVYMPTQDQLPEEPLKVAVALQADGEAYPAIKNVADQLARVLYVELDIKPTAEHTYLHPARQAAVYLGKNRVGVIGELDPELTETMKIRQRAAVLELDVNQLLAQAQRPAARPLSKFQPAYRDVTVLVDRHIPWTEIASTITQSGHAEPAYKGDYYGSDVEADKRALTVGLVLGSPDKTLTESEVEERLGQVLGLLEKNFGAKLRE